MGLDDAGEVGRHQDRVAKAVGGIRMARDIAGAVLQCCTCQHTAVSLGTLSPQRPCRWNLERTAHAAMQAQTFSGRALPGVLKHQQDALAGHVYVHAERGHFCFIRKVAMVHLQPIRHMQLTQHSSADQAVRLMVPALRSLPGNRNLG